MVSTFRASKLLRGSPGLLLAVTVVAVFLFVLPAGADGVVANCTDADLRQAIKEGGTITFACDGVITLTNTVLISTNITLDGTGRSVTISGNNAVRLFNVTAGAVLLLQHLKLADGYARGADGVAAGAAGGSGDGGA